MPRQYRLHKCDARPETRRRISARSEADESPVQSNLFFRSKLPGHSEGRPFHPKNEPWKSPRCEQGRQMRPAERAGRIRTAPCDSGGTAYLEFGSKSTRVGLQSTKQYPPD